VEKGEICEKESENAVLQRVGRQARAQECQQEEEGKSWNPKKTQGVDGGASMPYAPPRADSVLEVSVERGGNMCGRVRERGVFSVWDDRRERKNASRRGEKRNPKKTQGVDGWEVSMPTGGSQYRTHH
jgi:hypothetical protein